MQSIVCIVSGAAQNDIWVVSERLLFFYDFTVITSRELFLSLSDELKVQTRSLVKFESEKQVVELVVNYKSSLKK